MERLTHDADFGFEDWEETLFFVKSDPNGAYNILDIARFQGEAEFDEILKNIALRLAAYEDTGFEPEEIGELAVKMEAARPYKAFFEDLVDGQKLVDGQGEGAFSRGVNTGLDIARSAMRNPDAIPTLPHPSGWVSVNERLPSEEIDVLLLVRETEYYGKHGEKRHVYRWVFSGWNIDGEWATTYCHGHKMLSNQAEEDPKIEYKVTHWMPLPDPPEEVTNNAV